VTTKKKSVKRGKYEPRSDEFLKELAKEIWAGNVFCIWHMSKSQVELQFDMVFMVFVFLTLEQRKWFVKNDITFFYEEYRKAFPRGVNGLPMFASVQHLDSNDEKRLRVWYDKVKASMDGL
jgi:hypothetical protein